VFEAMVLNFLLDHRDQLGIQRIERFSNLLLDGAVVLTDERRLGVEVKYRMNWMKACQAEWQFRTFVHRGHTTVAPISGGLVFFEEFTGDWRGAGWRNWYLGHAEADGLRLDLLRLKNDRLETAPAFDP
jgi:hypothetical protein